MIKGFGVPPGLIGAEKFNHQAASEARSVIESLGIPSGSLGRLHDIAERLAGIIGTSRPIIERCDVIVFCGDHGISGRGVSAFPAEVTRSNMGLMVAGKASISIFCEIVGASLLVVDVGVGGDPLRSDFQIGQGIKFIDCRISPGTKDFSQGPAMTPHEAMQAIRVGYNLVIERSKDSEVVIFGEMGIGNTSSAAAIFACLLNLPVEEVTGFGSGISLEAYGNKCEIIKNSLKRLGIASEEGYDPLKILGEYGGFEVCAIVGGLLAAAEIRKPVLLDGYIVAAAALAAQRIAPGAEYVQIAATKSAEQGHKYFLSFLEQEPILSLGMRLGEGTAAVLAWPIVKAAASQLKRIASKKDLVPS